MNKININKENPYYNNGERQDMELLRMIDTLYTMELNGVILNDFQRKNIINLTEDVIKDLDSYDVYIASKYKKFPEEIKNYLIFPAINLKFMLLENASYIKRETFIALYNALVALKG